VQRAPLQPGVRAGVLAVDLVAAQIQPLLARRPVGGLDDLARPLPGGVVDVVGRLAARQVDALQLILEVPVQVAGRRRAAQVGQTGHVAVGVVGVALRRVGVVVADLAAGQSVAAFGRLQQAGLVVGVGAPTAIGVLLRPECLS